nr:hypothetical protein CFP56_31499 [Quercus suber]
MLISLRLSSSGSTNAASGSLIIGYLTPGSSQNRGDSPLAAPTIFSENEKDTSTLSVTRRLSRPQFPAICLLLEHPRSINYSKLRHPQSSTRFGSSLPTVSHPTRATADFYLDAISTQNHRFKPTSKTTSLSKERSGKLLTLKIHVQVVVVRSQSLVRRQRVLPP